MLDYYRLKARGRKCPTCKRGTLFFSVKQRVVSCVCSTPGCPSSMKFYSEEVVLYDTMYMNTKTKLDDSTKNVLHEKFDIIFNYKKKADIAGLKQHYMENKSAMESMNRTHSDRIEKRETILKHSLDIKEQCIKTIHQKRHDKEDVGISLYDDLNHALDTIRNITHMKLYKETTLRPEYSIENVV